MATNLVQIEKDEEIKQRLQAERARLRQIAGLDQPSHFHRPVERAFTAEERNQVTILFRRFHLEARRPDSRRLPGLRLSLREAAGA